MRLHAGLVGTLIWLAAAPGALQPNAIVPSKFDTDVRVADAQRASENVQQPSGTALTTSDEQLYANTIATMRDLPEPPYLTFTFNVTLRGEVTTELLDSHGFAVFRVWLRKAKAEGKGQPSGSWPVSHRASDDLGSVANTPHSHLLARSVLFNPTWTGAYDWLRYGIEGPPRNLGSNPQPSTESDKQLKVIGYVKALGPGAYRITAANPDVCPGRQQGRHLQLAARRGDIFVHPLTDVTIDLALTRFCRMRFHSPGENGISFAELRFGIVNGYWVTTNVDMDWHALAVLGARRADWHITYDDMRFPATLDDALFSLPDGPGGSHGIM